MPMPLPLEPHPDDSGFTASEVAHVLALTVFRTVRLPHPPPFFFFWCCALLLAFLL